MRLNSWKGNKARQYTGSKCQSNLEIKKGKHLVVVYDVIFHLNILVIFLTRKISPYLSVLGEIM